MAVLKDLIVHGPSRFLNAAYYNKIDADEISTNTIALQKITAKTNNTISIVAGLVDVDGELHTKSFTNSNIATIDGSFYITPTISLQGDETNGYTAVATNNSISFSGTSYNLGSAYLDGSDSPIAWSTGSTVIVTGEVLVNNEWIPLGTLKGTLSTYSTNTNPNVVGITNILDSVNQSSKILGLIAGTGNLPYRKVKISLISVNRSGLKPLGIYMTAAGSNGRTFLDIYGGNLAESTTYGGLSTPVVRIGNLSGSNLPPVGNVTPNGWGIYTSNGFFSGTVAARQGKIGNGTAIWTIGSDGNSRSYIYSGINNITNSGTTKGIYVGTNGISNYENSTQYVNLTGGKITAQGADIQGVLKADTGRIGGSSGWTIASQQISSGTLGSDNSMYLSTKNLSGTVSGKTFDSSNPAWRLTVGSNFGITNTGSLYASEAVISGAITANSLNVGSVSDPNHLIYNSSTGVIDLSTSWLKFDSIENSVTIGGHNKAGAYLDPDTFNVTNEDGVKFFSLDMDGEMQNIAYNIGKYETDVSDFAGYPYRWTITIKDSIASELDTGSTFEVRFIEKGSEESNGVTYSDRAYFIKGTAKNTTLSIGGETFTANYNGDKTFVFEGYVQSTEFVDWIFIIRKQVTLPTPSYTIGTRIDEAKGSFSATIGEGLSASHANQIVIGKYNEDSSNTAFVIGNGSSNTLSNALTVDWNGVLNCRRPNISGAPSAVKNEFASIFDLIYPVGAIYISVNSTNPSYLFGGTWTQIEGRFLLAAGTSEGKTYTVGQTDAGSKDAVVVSHSHEPTDSGYRFMHAHASLSGGDMSGPSGSGRHYPYLGNRSDGAYWGSGTTTASTGVSGTDKNMPPYTVVYMWKRTA